MNNKINFGYELSWNKVPLVGTHENPIAFDTETSIDNEIDRSVINKLAVIQASDGNRTVLLHPDELVDFLNAHKDIPFVGHNFAYDFWIVLNHLKENGYTKEADEWWEKCDKGLFHDTMILDALIKLAKGEAEGTKFYMRNLGEVAKKYAGITLNKQDPYRKRYGEIIGKKLDEVQDI
jgi:hypothetical protein